MTDNRFLSTIIDSTIYNVREKGCSKAKRSYWRGAESDV